MTPERRRLKPAEGKTVALEPPAKGDVPAKGAELPLTQYYRRRIDDGDLVECEPPARGKQAPAKEEGK